MSGSRPAPRVLTIPPGVPFLATLAEALIGGQLVPGWPDPADPLSLAQGTVYLPTRRAARALAVLLAEHAAARGPGTILLPRIVPLGETDEVEAAALMAGLATDDDRPEVGPVERRLALARLVLGWAASVRDTPTGSGSGPPPRVVSGAGDAVALAGDLGTLIDTLAIYGKDWQDVHALVPGEYDAYWEQTRVFLAVAAAGWPRYLEAGGMVDGSRRRHDLLVAQAARLRTTRPDTPTIVAGSTGSMPATAALIAAIANLPRGAVVLPGLDQSLDEASWDVIGPRAADSGHPGHPQAVLAGLIATVGIVRDQVVPLGIPAPALEARARFVSEALRPAETTDLWAQAAHRLAPGDITAALAGIDVVEATDDREEALAVACALREAIAEPDRTAALITPDRGIAARVAAELGRWGISVDDSAGLPLLSSSAGLLARLAAEAVASECAAVALLALLDHPWCRLGLGRATVLRGRATLEIGVLRGPAPGPGLAGLAAGLSQMATTPAADRHRWPGPKRRLQPADWQAAAAVLTALGEAMLPWNGIGGDLIAMTEAHRATIAVLAAPPPVESVPPDASLADLETLFDEVRAGGVTGLAGQRPDYPPFFAALAAGRVVRRADSGHRRIRIWGLLEARLLPADTVVLAGLDERSWPAEAQTDAFLNRPMRHQLGLPSPERRLGQTAHDFEQAMGAGRVVLTRALKRGGDPTVASRFLQRMAAVAGTTQWTAACGRGEIRLAQVRQLDRPAVTAAIRRPAPVLAPERVPDRLSFTEVETLVRDPYAIYARRVLHLDRLDALAEPPGATLRGTLVHDVAGQFSRVYPAALPANSSAELKRIGRAVFDAAPALADRPETMAFWFPRFLRVADWLAAWEAERRVGGLVVLAEITGRLDLPMADGRPFTLSGRADRIELRPGGGIAIVDFKTGAPPGVQEVRVGFSPQLTLEAAVARRGGFPELPAVTVVEELLYVQLSGGSKAGAERVIQPKQSEPPFEINALADEHLSKLAKLIEGYRAGWAFVSRPYPKFAKRFSAYDHFARVQEWSLGDSNGEDVA